MKGKTFFVLCLFMVTIISRSAIADHGKLKGLDLFVSVGPGQFVDQGDFPYDGAVSTTITVGYGFNNSNAIVLERHITAYKWTNQHWHLTQYLGPAWFHYWSQKSRTFFAVGVHFAPYPADDPGSIYEFTAKLGIEKIKHVGIVVAYYAVWISGGETKDRALFSLELQWLHY